MFGRGRTDKGTANRDIGLLGVDTRFEGRIRFRGTLRIDGTVTGNIESEPGSGSMLIVNQNATVTGDVVSDSVLISGRVEGDVHARDRVEIFRSGFLAGDVYTADIMIEGGAEFRGYCHMSDAAPPGADPAPQAGAPGGEGAPPQSQPPEGKEAARA